MFVWGRGEDQGEKFRLDQSVLQHLIAKGVQEEACGEFLKHHTNIILLAK